MRTTGVHLMPGSFYELSLIDSTRETSGTRLNIGDLTTTSLAGALAQMGDVRVAIEGVTLGAVSGSQFGDKDIIVAATPSNPLAQRGVKWTVSLQDNVLGYISPIHIPTADLSLLVAGNDDLVITAGPGLALKSAIEALARSRAGNPVTVIRVYYSD